VALFEHLLTKGGKMPQSLSYNKDITKWGDLVRAIKEIPELLLLLDNEGIFSSNLDAIDKSEAEGRAADAAQRKAENDLAEITPKLATKVEELTELFKGLKRRLPNAIDDLKTAGKTEVANAALKVEFAKNASPRVPKEIAKGEAPSTEVNPERAADTESRAQKSIADAAIALESYLGHYPALVEALITRKAAPTFKEDLVQKGNELLALRNERVKLLAAKLDATTAEHNAVKKHIEERQKVDPTTTALAKTNRVLDGLLVTHLGRQATFKKKG
jgi:hypothetical protein